MLGVLEGEITAEGVAQQREGLACQPRSDAPLVQRADAEGDERVEARRRLPARLGALSLRRCCLPLAPAEDQCRGVEG